METLKIKNHHLALTIWGEGGRILEVQSLSSGAQLVSWWPFKADNPESAGGIGEFGLPGGASQYSWEKSRNSVTLKRCLPGDLVLKKKITLPADSLVFTVSLSITNTSDSARQITLGESAAICPGFGGACPRAESGISHCREKVVFKRDGASPETVHYEVFENLRVERDDLEWAAFSDPVSDNMLSVVLPAGHVTISTNYHWRLEWSDRLTIEPGGEASVDFHFAATGAIDLPLVVGEHIVAGFKGATAPLSGEGGGKFVLYGLNEAAEGNEIAVEVNGRELVGGKPVPAGREPVEVPLPKWHREAGVSIEASVAGKYGRARLVPSQYVEARRQVEEAVSQAREAAASGRMSHEKAACAAALSRIVETYADRDADFLEALTEKTFYEVSAIIDSPVEAKPFYTKDEKDRLARMAQGIDLGGERAALVERLSRKYDLAMPRFREADSSAGAFAAAAGILEGALYLAARPDKGLLGLVKERLGDFTSMWRKFGQIRYETIHHGVLLCRLIPAVKIACENGWLSAEEEVDALAMVIDLCRKIERQGGRQFRLSNWWAMESAPLAYVGALYPFLPWAGGWRTRARETFYWLLVHGTYADGGFWEMSPSYHLVTLTYLHHIAEALVRSGQNLYHDGACGRSLSDMTGFVKAIAAPAGAVPAFDDGHRTAPGETLLALAKRYGDGELAFHAHKAFRRAGREAGAWALFVPVEGPEPVEPRRSSQVLIPSGKLVFRSACRTFTLIFDFGPHGGWHGHSDKLSFEAFWRDMCVVPDAGCYKYEEALHWQWFKTAPAHNTVTLGDLDRVQASGELLYFMEGRGFITAGMSAPIDEKVQHRREVTLSDRAVLIDDFIENAPAGESLVWRLNSFVPFEVSSGSARFTRGGLTLVVTPVSAGLDIETAEVPLVGEGASGRGEYDTGWQLRIAKRATGQSDRILVRIDFEW